MLSSYKSGKKSNMNNIWLLSYAATQMWQWSVSNVISLAKHWCIKKRKQQLSLSIYSHVTTVINLCDNQQYPISVSRFQCPELFSAVLPIKWIWHQGITFFTHRLEECEEEQLRSGLLLDEAHEDGRWNSLIMVICSLVKSLKFIGDWIRTYTLDR